MFIKMYIHGRQKVLPVLIKEFEGSSTWYLIQTKRGNDVLAPGGNQRSECEIKSYHGINRVYVRAGYDPVWTNDGNLYTWVNEGVATQVNEVSNEAFSFLLQKEL